MRPKGILSYSLRGGVSNLLEVLSEIEWTPMIPEVCYKRMATQRVHVMWWLHAGSNMFMYTVVDQPLHSILYRTSVISTCPHAPSHFSPCTLFPPPLVFFLSLRAAISRSLDPVGVIRRNLTEKRSMLHSEIKERENGSKKYIYRELYGREKGKWQDAQARHWPTCDVYDRPAPEDFPFGSGINISKG